MHADAKNKAHASAGQMLAWLQVSIHFRACLSIPALFQCLQVCSQASVGARQLRCQPCRQVVQRHTESCHGKPAHMMSPYLHNEGLYVPCLLCKCLQSNTAVWDAIAGHVAGRSHGGNTNSSSTLMDLQEVCGNARAATVIHPAGWLSSSRQNAP